MDRNAPGENRNAVENQTTRHSVVDPQKVWTKARRKLLVAGNEQRQVQSLPERDRRTVRNSEERDLAPREAHTFATTVTYANGVSIESISKMLGHTKISTTQIYARIVDKIISDEMDKLARTLNNTKFSMGSQTK
mgnify:CR=1 FL=1